MALRDLIPARNTVPVVRGAHPIRTFQDEVNALFDDFFSDLTLPAVARAGQVRTAVDLAETDKAFVVTAEVPGIEAKDLSLSAAEGYLTLKGERKQESREDKGGYFRQERSFGSFQRVIGLPANADLDAAKAEMKNGILTIEVPKKAAPKVEEKKIEIAHA
jgi:HSP20 family protein